MMNLNTKHLENVYVKKRKALNKYLYVPIAEKTWKDNYNKSVATRTVEKK